MCLFIPSSSVILFYEHRSSNSPQIVGVNLIYATRALTKQQAPHAKAVPHSFRKSLPQASICYTRSSSCNDLLNLRYLAALR